MEPRLYIKSGIGLVIAGLWGLVFAGILALDMLKTTIQIFVTGAYILAILYTPGSYKG